MRNRSFIKDSSISLNPNRGGKTCELLSGNTVAKNKGTMQKRVRSRSLMTWRAYRFLPYEQLEIPALESVFKDIFQNDWISWLFRVDEHRCVQSIVILIGAVTVTSYLICVFDTEAWRESACFSEEYRVVYQVRSLLRICMQQEVLIVRPLIVMK